MLPISMKVSVSTFADENRAKAVSETGTGVVYAILGMFVGAEARPFASSNTAG
jgi:hypothetical protein